MHSSIYTSPTPSHIDWDPLKCHLEIIVWQKRWPWKHNMVHSSLYIVPRNGSHLFFFFSFSNWSKIMLHMVVLHFMCALPRDLHMYLWRSLAFVNWGGGCNFGRETSLIVGIPETLDMLRSLVRTKVVDIASMVISKALRFVTAWILL